MGRIIGKGAVKMDTDKEAVVQDWSVSQRTFNVRLFIGFPNFYRCFRQGFSGIVRPLMALIRKGVKFKWSEEFQQAFETLKEPFVMALFVAHFHFTKTMMVKTDTSD